MIVFMLIGLGLIFGSFVNAFVWRVHEGRGWVNDRSECTKCHHRLAPKDLVPVLSYLLLKGRCRYCRQPIQDTPLAELLVPATFVISYLAWPLPLHGVGLMQFIFWLFYMVIFAALAVYDLRWYLLPDKLVATVTGVALIDLGVRFAVFGKDWHSLVWAAISALIISGLFYAMFQLSKGQWIGGGDVKMGFVLGLLAGTPLHSLLLLFVASMSGTLAVLPFMLAGKARRKVLIPFGPFLIFGLFVVRLWGKDIIDWYMNFL
jgi:prepilin signal peptidase PulO-like enzyme (type II secretory pathway)